MRIPAFFFLLFSIASVLAQGDPYPTRPIRILICAPIDPHGGAAAKDRNEALQQPIVAQVRDQTSQAIRLYS